MQTKETHEPQLKEIGELIDRLKSLWSGKVLIRVWPRALIEKNIKRDQDNTIVDPFKTIQIHDMRGIIITMDSDYELHNQIDLLKNALDLSNDRIKRLNHQCKSPDGNTALKAYLMAAHPDVLMEFYES